MSKFRIIPYAVLAAGLLAGSGAYAQSMSTIDAREAQQQQRIRDGIRDGSLTRSEANRLQQGEQRIERAEQRARADGVVTGAERRRLDGMLDRESRAITHERNDGQRRDGWGGQHGWNRDGHQGWNRDGRQGWQANRGFDHRGGYQQNHTGRDGAMTPGNAGHVNGTPGHASTGHHYGQTTPATGTAPSQHGWTGTRGTSPGTATHTATTTPRTSTPAVTTPRSGVRTATTGSTGGRSFGGAGRHR